MNFISKVCVIAAMTAVAPTMVLAQADKKTPDVKAKAEKTINIDELKVSAQSYIRTGYTTDYAKKQLMKVYRTTDVDGGGVTQSDYKMQEQITNANRRGYSLLNWLRMDLNGDGTVSRKEVEVLNRSRASRPIYHQGIQLEPTEDQVKQILKKLVDKALGDDADKDGNITFAEAVAAANKKQRARRTSRYNKLRYTHRVPLSLDSNKDGKVSKEEFSQAVDLLLSQVDLDKNGQLSRSEVSTYTQAVYALRRTMR